MAGIPLFKIGVLFIRTLAKPLAKRIKSQAAAHPTLRHAVIGLGNLLNHATTQVEVRVMGHVPKSIKPLKEEAAVARGTEFLGESFIFAVAAFFVVLEYNRQQVSKAKDAAAKERRKREKANAQKARDEVIERAVLRMDARIARLERTLWLSGGAGHGEEEMLRRDRAAAKRQLELARTLADTRVPSLSELAAAEEARERGEDVPRPEALADELDDSGAGDGRPGPRVKVERATMPSRWDILSRPSERQRAIAAVSEILAQVGPHWTHGFSRHGACAGSDAAGDDGPAASRRCTLLRQERA